MMKWSPNAEMTKRRYEMSSSLRLRHSFVIRHSCFVIHSLRPPLPNPLLFPHWRCATVSPRGREERIEMRALYISSAIIATA